MRLSIDKKLEKRIIQYVNGELTELEIDQLWADLIQDGHYLEYLKTIANLQRPSEKRRTSSTSQFNTFR